MALNTTSEPVLQRVFWEAGVNPRTNRKRQPTHSVKSKIQSHVKVTVCLLLLLSTIQSSVANYTFTKLTQGIFVEHIGQAQLCKKARERTDGTHYEELAHHISETVVEISHNMENILNIRALRNKRGLFGEFMTSVFGVNDQVYRDIDSLQDNQNHLINTANQEAKLLISGTSTMKGTKDRINKKLENFRKKQAK
ncbi:hypothetical protein HHI36_000926 [Cryptolaemus montrouzieri]|uniref:Uncharacterized protein n=1 Tax=Cryptolaemus montrouzieri TaxID=559131 RepID=A0ABD2P6R3_9CUCU